MRSIWNGAITFGLINISVKLYGAVEDKGVHLHLMHEKDGERVHYKRVCSKGHEVDWEDIVRGYEYEKGKYVTFTDEELDNLQVDSLRTIDVVTFVPLEEIDPVYFDKTYYVVPDEAGLKAYRLLQDAVDGENRVGIAKVALRDKEHLACLRVQDDVFVLETMHWPDEIRKPKFDQLNKTPRLNPNEKKMARALLTQLAGEFDPSAFTDEFRKNLKKLAKKKAEGKEITVPEEEPREDTSAVVDLMDALKKSVEEARTRPKSKSKRKAPSRKSSRSKPSKSKAS